jgi:tetratricopeptide (TPR) repeat protein
VKRNFFVLAFTCSLVLAGYGFGQTFEVGGQSSPQKQNTPKKGKKSSGPGLSGQKSTTSSTELGGWGSSIQVGRYARAAQQALSKGNYPAAMNFAQRMVQDAPNDPRNWFLLGYTSRLAGNYSVSLNAYDKGLSQQPNSVEGLSGKAQTYIRMGKSDEAKKLLLQVIAANPRRAVDLAMAGELFMQSGDLPRAINLLERSEAVGPSSHAELLLAIAYMKSKQQDKA